MWTGIGEQEFIGLHLMDHNESTRIGVPEWVEQMVRPTLRNRNRGNGCGDRRGTGMKGPDSVDQNNWRTVMSGPVLEYRNTSTGIKRWE